MGRSYLFSGQDTEHLSPAQRQLESLYDQIDRPGNRISPTDFFKSPEYGQWLATNYGDLGQQVPPGSQIINQTPFQVTYRDSDGYETTISRNGADAATAGTISRQTNRPAVLPNQQQQNFQNFLQQQYQQQIQGAIDKANAAPALTQLDPATLAQLNAMSQAEQAKNAQNATDLRSQLVAQLYGNGVNQSSVANDAAARFAQLQGLVNQQQQADAATRQLGVQQYLTGVGQQNQQNLQSILNNIGSLYGNVSGQQTQSNLANASLGLDQQKLQEQINEFAKQYNLGSLNAQTQQEQLDAQNSLFNNILKGVQAASGLAGGIGTGLSAFNALTRNKNSGGQGTLGNITYG